MLTEFPRDVGGDEWRRALRDCPSRELTTSMRAVLFALSSWSDHKTGGNCYPTQKWIAIAAGLKEKSAQRLLSRAERMGWIRSWSVPVPGKRVSCNHYQLTLPGASTLPLKKPRHRYTAGSFTRGKLGKFATTTPLHSADDTAVRALTTPLCSGASSSKDLPLPTSTGLSTGVDGMRERAIELIHKGWDDATIAGVMARHEISDKLIAQWRAEIDVPF